ncbi:MAG TPA: hypothetical protein VMB34_10390 [Acetobacteraceae bacterium]|nr:hypothetical protein [Acetobacteraceae bacterium]
MLAFRLAFPRLEHCIAPFLALPPGSLDRMALAHNAIGHPRSSTAEDLAS